MSSPGSTYNKPPKRKYISSQLNDSPLSQHSWQQGTRKPMFRPQGLHRLGRHPGQALRPILEQVCRHTHSMA